MSAKPKYTYVPEAGHVWNPLREWPRNRACFCGSGQKFKRCHADRLPLTVPTDRGQAIYTAMSAGEPGLASLEGYFKAKYPLEKRAEPSRP